MDNIAPWSKGVEPLWATFCAALQVCCKLVSQKFSLGSRQNNPISVIEKG